MSQPILVAGIRSDHLDLVFITVVSLHNASRCSGLGEGCPVGTVSNQSGQTGQARVSSGVS